LVINFQQTVFLLKFILGVGYSSKHHTEWQFIYVQCTAIYTNFFVLSAIACNFQAKLYRVI